MTTAISTAQTVKRLLEAGANAEIVGIALEAIEEAEEAVREAARPKPRIRNRKKPEVVASRA